MQNIVERFDGDVSSEQIQTWIEQFDDSERRYIMPLLSHFRYYSSRRLFSLLKNLHQSIRSHYSEYSVHTRRLCGKEWVGGCVLLQKA